MPTAKELLIVCAVSVVVSVAMVFLMRLVGLEDYAVVVAAVSAGVASGTVGLRLRSSEQDEQASGLKE